MLRCAGCAGAGKGRRKGPRRRSATLPSFVLTTGRQNPADFSTLHNSIAAIRFTWISPTAAAAAAAAAAEAASFQVFYRPPLTTK